MKWFLLDHREPQLSTKLSEGARTLWALSFTAKSQISLHRDCFSQLAVNKNSCPFCLCFWRQYICLSDWTEAGVGSSCAKAGGRSIMSGKASYRQWYYLWQRKMVTFVQVQQLVMFFKKILHFTIYIDTFFLSEITYD